MIGEYRVVVVILAGRRRYMECLLPYLLREEAVDEVRFWVNTTDKEDIAWIRQASFSYAKCVMEDRGFRPNNPPGNQFNQFYDKCIDPKTVYVKIDDDIVWLQKDCIKKLATYHIEHPEHFVVHANVFNNGVCDYLNACSGLFDGLPKGGMDAACGLYWKEPWMAVLKHEHVLKMLQHHEDELPHFDPYIFTPAIRVSINCLTWLGSEFAKFEGKVPHDDEVWMSLTKPNELKKSTVILREAYCSHYAYYTQRELLDRTGVLDKYRNLIIRTLDQKPISESERMKIKEIHLQDGCCSAKNFVSKSFALLNRKIEKPQAVIQVVIPVVIPEKVGFFDSLKKFRIFSNKLV